MLGEIFWNIMKFVGYVMIMYQLQSLAFALAFACIAKGTKVSVLFATFDLWWGTFYDRKNRKLYWMIPFVGLVFEYPEI